MERKVLFNKISPTVGKIILNNPQRRNSMDGEMAEAFRETVDFIRMDSSDLKLIIVEGVGSDFSSGGDRDMLLEKTKKSPFEQELEMLDFYRSFASISEIDVPTLAIIRGWCIGAALCLAALCDLRLAFSDAKLSASFIKIGLFPGLGSTLLFAREFGFSTASYLLISGEVVTAEDAYRLGIVHWKVEDENSAKSVISNLENTFDKIPREALSLTVKKLRELRLTGLNQAFQLEASTQAICYSSEWFTRLLNKQG